MPQKSILTFRNVQPTAQRWVVSVFRFEVVADGLTHMLDTCEFVALFQLSKFLDLYEANVGQIACENLCVKGVLHQLHATHGQQTF